MSKKFLKMSKDIQSVGQRLIVILNQVLKWYTILADKYRLARYTPYYEKGIKKTQTKPMETTPTDPEADDILWCHGAFPFMITRT